MSLFFGQSSLYLEVRIPPAQPATLVFSRSLPAFGNQRGKRPEIRRRMAMRQRQQNMETPSQCDNVHLPLRFLWRAVLGVTLA